MNRIVFHPSAIRPEQTLCEVLMPYIRRGFVNKSRGKRLMLIDPDEPETIFEPVSARAPNVVTLHRPRSTPPEAA